MKTNYRTKWTDILEAVCLVIDATGRDYNVINRQRSMLQMLGYDTYMIFVNTSLEVALQRNRVRTRSCA